jgi:LytR cell envelope-related transcriptional attenuator
VAHLNETGISIHRRRRRRRAAITLILVCLALVGTFAYAAAYFQGWLDTKDPKPAASSACPAVTPAALVPSDVTINVYNATNRGGLAASVAKSLRAQGFKIGQVANDPLGKRITGAGEVRHGQIGTAGATIVATRLAGARVVLDKRPDETVDLVLGNAFSALKAPPKSLPPSATKPAPSRTGTC